MANTTRKPLAAAVGAAFLTSVALTPVASATENPFQASELKTGYQLAGAHKEGGCGADRTEEGKCGEAKCGEDKAAKKADTEGQCGEAKADKEGKCGESKADEEGKCGGE